VIVTEDLRDVDPERAREMLIDKRALALSKMVAEDFGRDVFH
jgi:hypothetical protein